MRPLLITHTLYMVIVGLVLLVVPSLVSDALRGPAAGVARALGVAYAVSGFLSLLMLRHRRSRTLVRCGLMVLGLLHTGMAAVHSFGVAGGHVTVLAPIIHAFFAAGFGVYLLQVRRQRGHGPDAHNGGTIHET